MQKINLKPLKHILVCVNEREDKSRNFCAKVDGMEIYQDLKAWVKSNGLAGAVWVTRTGCLGFCNNVGTTIVIYPDQLWFKEITKEDVPKIKEMILDSLGKVKLCVLTFSC